MRTRSRHRIVLYNPRAVFHTMPLALLAVATALDRTRFDVRIVDGRFEPDPIRTVLEAAAGALCVGVTVLTGAPIHDALAISRAVKQAQPAVPVVWGGWHPSLFPRQCLDEPSIDAVVSGQGEHTFAELVERLAAGRGLDGVAGVAYRRDEAIVVNAARGLADLNALPPHDYELIDVERYFTAKGRRQIDYISSQGCRFRCAFCADPAVYRRGWSGLNAERVGGDLDRLVRQHRVQEAAFQDETFFTSAQRVEGICDELLRRGIDLGWTATLRADQSARMPEAVFATAVRSGLRRVMVGVESGSARLLDWMKKDMTVEHVLGVAERCVRHRVAAIFNFIVGFPGESDDEVAATLRLVKRLRAMSPAFDTPIFSYRPYPGSAIAESAQAMGYQFPQSLEGWADFDYVNARGPWIGAERWRDIERFRFYARQAWTASRWRWPLRTVSRWRCEHDCYAFPVEKQLAELVRPRQAVS
ncbi:MAG TPA: radical SAM protein [Vicinamibacterales bacterium]|nr:radical SAM protein [Vicinamibacterales bacterium]